MDVISQGRDPKREFRLPLSRRWRIVAGCAAALVVAAVALTVCGLLSQHDGGTAGDTGAPGAAVSLPPPVPLPASQDGLPPAFIVCSPSPQACTNKLVIINGRAAHFSQQDIRSGH